MVEMFATGFFEYLKVFFVGIMIYGLIYSMLIKLEILGNKSINSLVALVAAIIVSFTGVVTYAISYAINWFVIIFFILFLVIVLLMFLGVDAKEIGSVATSNKKLIMTIMLILFSIIIIKGFFALNNTFDVNEPIENQYDVDTSFNTGIDDVTNSEIDEGFWNSFSIDSDLLASALFLLAIGGFVFIIG